MNDSIESRVDALGLGAAVAASLKDKLYKLSPSTTDVVNLAADPELGFVGELDMHGRVFSFQTIPIVMVMKGGS